MNTREEKPVKSILLATAALVLVLLCGLFLARPAEAAFPGDNGRIAFTSDRDGNAEVYATDADGTNPVRLTNNQSADIEPAFSPDGSRIAFASNRDGDFEIYTMNVDGTNQTNLTNDLAQDLIPAYSPDGARIAFTTFVSFGDADREIYAMDASDGSGQTSLTNDPAFDMFPAFSPDGSQLAFASDRDGNEEVYVMNSDGSGTPANVTNHPARDSDPDWQPVPVATEVGLNVNPNTPTFPSLTTLSGWLTDASGDPLAGRRVILQRKPAGTAEPFRAFRGVSTGAGPSRRG